MKHDARIGPQVARRNAGDLLSLTADRGYNAKAFRDELRTNGVRPLIKHWTHSALPCVCAAGRSNSGK